jgi:DNA primase
MEHQAEPGFVASRFFVQHPDEQISQMGALLVSDQYQLSATFLKDHNVTDDIENLNHNVPLMVVDLILAIVNGQIKDVMAKIQADTERSNDEQMQLMGQYKSLKESQQRLQQMLKGQ